MSDDAELAHAIAGAGGGALSMIVTYPLVTLSTLAQTTRKTKETEETGEKKSTLAQIREALRQRGGMLSLYAGLESALYGVTLLNFIYYYFYELTSSVFLTSNAAAQKRKRGLSTMQLIATGAIAGAITVISTNPFWVANTRMMTMAKENGKSRSAFRALVDIAQRDGVSTLFAGVLPALVLVINPIIQYTIFEQIKNVIVAARGVGGFSAGNAFFIGALGKLVATTLTYPYITLKSRMHVRKNNSTSEADTADENGKGHLSMYQEIRKIITEEGVEGLYRGLAIKSFQSVMTAAFLFYFKEELFSRSLTLVGILRGRKLVRKLT